LLRGRLFLPVFKLIKHLINAVQLKSGCSGQDEATGWWAEDSLNFHHSLTLRAGIQLESFKHIFNKK
jgi:hypothetical protein